MRAKSLKRHAFLARPKSALADGVGSKWSEIPENQAAPGHFPAT
jgi:hypothetical protein